MIWITIIVLASALDVVCVLDLRAERRARLRNMPKKRL